MPKPASAKGGLANIQPELGKLMKLTIISIPHERIGLSDIFHLCLIALRIKLGCLNPAAL
jgi:hypothetical protein